MSLFLFTVQISAYGLALWLGLYVLARDPANPRLRLAGLGLLAYALGLATDLLAQTAPPAAAAWLIRLHWPLLFLPAVFWFGAAVHLLPPQWPWLVPLRRLWGYGLLPVAVPFYLVSAGTNIIFDFSTTPPRPGPAYLLFAGLTLLPLLAALALVWWSGRGASPKMPVGLLLAATIFFALGAGLLIFPLNWLPRRWLLPAISLDFAALGLAVALLDAFDLGESFLPDFLRSFDAALFSATLFGGLVAAAMAAGPGLTLPMAALLLAVIAAAIATQTLADFFQSALDWAAFAAFPRLRQERAALRTAAGILPRLNPAIVPEALPEAEFVRLTRRALSHLGDLPRLAASPLTRLAVIDDRLARACTPNDTLARAAALKELLTRSIRRLKPPGPDEFGVTDEWRFYNALYFPYVAGLKPYSRRPAFDELDPAARQAFDWFRAAVPERTLYNWQNAAARLIALDILEKQP